MTGARDCLFRPLPLTQIVLYLEYLSILYYTDDISSARNKSITVSWNNARCL